MPEITEDAMPEISTTTSEESYTTGPTARIAEISDSTLRSWEKFGLIPPPRRSSDGRRQYTKLEVARIRALAARRREADPRRK
jgi:DNA-binding transcriptional MerR regulator